MTASGSPSPVKAGEKLTITVTGATARPELTLRVGNENLQATGTMIGPGQWTFSIRIPKDAQGFVTALLDDGTCFDRVTVRIA